MQVSNNNDWTESRVEAVSTKQDEALRLAWKSEMNVYNLALDEVEIICKSKKPRMVGRTALFNADYLRTGNSPHHDLWQRMESMSVEDLAKSFEAQIQNRRLLSEFLDSNA